MIVGFVVTSALIAGVVWLPPWYRKWRDAALRRTLADRIASRDWEGTVSAYMRLRGIPEDTKANILADLYGEFRGLIYQDDEETRLWAYRHLLQVQGRFHGSNNLSEELHGLLAKRGLYVEALAIWRGDTPIPLDAHAYLWKLVRLLGQIECLTHMEKHEQALELTRQLRDLVVEGLDAPLVAYWWGLDAQGLAPKPWVVAYVAILEARSLLAMGSFDDCISRLAPLAQAEAMWSELVGWGHMLLARAYAARGDVDQGLRHAKMARGALAWSLVTEGRWAAGGKRALLRRAIDMQREFSDQTHNDKGVTQPSRTEKD